MNTTTTTRKTFGTHAIQPVAVLPLKGLVHWQVNPRHDLTAGGEEMRESLLAVGQMDDVHVWKCIDGDKILRGNRRVANMRRLGWTECRQVVHEFSDERDAYLFLLEDRGFGHSMDLSADEKILAVENGVKMGMSAEDMQACLGVTEERVQLWWDLGECLPAVARDALHVGTLSMATAQLLLKIDDKDGRREAAQMVMKDLDGEPMAPGQAKNVIELQFVLPEKWRKAWAVLDASRMAWAAMAIFLLFNAVQRQFTWQANPPTKRQYRRPRRQQKNHLLLPLKKRPNPLRP